MSCYYKALHRLIPELILTAGRGAEVAIVSPWIWNVDLTTPKFGTGKASYSKTKIKMREFLIRMLRNFNFRILFVIRPDDESTYKAIKPIIQVAPNQVTISEFDYIHAKIIATPMFALEMTANMIHTSLYRNIESCTLVENRFLDSRKYLRDKLGIIV